MTYLKKGKGFIFSLPGKTRVIMEGGVVVLRQVQSIPCSHLLIAGELTWENYATLELGDAPLVQAGKCAPVVKRMMEISHCHRYLSQVLKKLTIKFEAQKKAVQATNRILIFFFLFLIFSIIMWNIQSYEVITKPYGILYEFMYDSELFISIWFFTNKGVGLSAVLYKALPRFT